MVQGCSERLHLKKYISNTLSNISNIYQLRMLMKLFPMSDYMCCGVLDCRRRR